mmetsp:Transcript_7445/g.17852  ORF Transcript_7445/g.17852 Transcript_7445/m.17852 type:complete len:641 (-) Transcript_7445:150-2072(-)
MQSNSNTMTEAVEVSTTNEHNKSTISTTTTTTTTRPKRTTTTRQQALLQSPTHCASPAAVAAVAAANSNQLVGRRGDIRMHKAVAARLADPSISLFDALTIGGFDYPSDDSATALDDDNVTLGQRKNQLSRRIRLAKKQQQQKTKVEKKGSQNNNNETLQVTTADQFVHHHNSSTPQKNATACAHPHEPNDHPSTPTLLEEEDTACRHHRHYDGAIETHTNQHNKDEAAIASLMDSAQAVGLTLDQLAETIAANRTNLCSLIMERDHSQCCSNSSSSSKMMCPTRQKQERVALKLHEIESKALYDKCLVLADADLEDEYAPFSKQHLAFCFKAWQAEGKRLGGLMEKHHPQWKDDDDFSPEWRRMIQQPILHSQDGDDAKGTTFARNNNKRTQSTGNSGDSSSSKQKKKNKKDHNHLHHNNKNKACHNPTGFHIHRLDGHCGHKAIIHNPKDGVPHIDFIVGDVVECYHGVEPIKRQRPKKQGLPPPSDRVIKWQSKYTCGEMDCSGDCSSDGLVDPNDKAVVNLAAAADDSSSTTTVAAGGSCPQQRNYHHHQQHYQQQHQYFLPPTIPTCTPTPQEQLQLQLQPTMTTETAAAAVAAAEPKTIPIAKIKENDPEWNFDPDESMDDLLNGLLMHNELVY